VGKSGLAAAVRSCHTSNWLPNKEMKMTGLFLKMLPDILTCVLFVILIMRSWRHDAAIKMLETEIASHNEEIKALHAANVKLAERIGRSLI
jgi:hypothetical protein